MALKLRPTGLGYGIDKDRADYTVFSGKWNIGRIYERHGFPDAVRFFWSLHGVVLTRPPGIHTDGHTPSLERPRKQSSRAIGFLGWSGQRRQRSNDQA